MSLIGLELDKMDDKRESEMGEMHKPKYPPGLCIYLDEATLHKLGIKGIPAAGEDIYLCAVAEVVSVSVSKPDDGNPERSLSLQIKELELMDDKLKKKYEPKVDAVKAMYGE